jgi:hypothetical protein
MSTKSSIVGFFLCRPALLTNKLWKEALSVGGLTGPLWSDCCLDFGRCKYRGTIFSALAEPETKTREQIAMILDELNGAKVLGLAGYEHGNAKEYLDNFYQHTAARRSLESIPVSDRTYAVCRCFLDRLVPDPQDANGLHLLPSSVLCRLTIENSEDPRFITHERIDRLSRGDTQLLARLRYERGFFSTIIARIYGVVDDATKPPILGDPELVLRICHLAAPEAEAVAEYENTLIMVPFAYCQFSICMAFYEGDPENLKYFPEALRPAYL